MLMLKDRDSVLVELRKNLEVAQSKKQEGANKHRIDMEYSVGDWVYLKLKPYRQISMAKRRNEKLAQHYFRPYKVAENICRVAYKLELPVHSQIHPVFYISQLKMVVLSASKLHKLPVILTPSLE